MPLSELGIPQTVCTLLEDCEPLSYYSHFVNSVDNLMASPSEAAIATWDLYRNKTRQDTTKTVTTWWRRIQRLGTTAFGHLCTWTKDQQEVAFSCLIKGSRNPKELAVPPTRISCF